MSVYSMQALAERVSEQLRQAGSSSEMAASTARALVQAEAQGLKSHGLARVRQYANHLVHGRVNGQARAHIVQSRGGAFLVDAQEGLAFPACDLAMAEAIGRAREYGISVAAVTHSHHFGPAAIHLETAARNGMVALAFSNSPAAMPVAGGKRALLGTNPIAALFPRRDQGPVVIDLSLSTVARGKLLVAAEAGKPIPEGWALDQDGGTTTDPRVGLAGMMCPLGGAKGAVLALAVELLCATLGGAALAFEADSFFQKDGNRPRLGHVFIVIDPSALAGIDIYYERLETLINAMLLEDSVRLPGDKRQQNLRDAQLHGLEVDDALFGG